MFVVSKKEASDSLGLELQVVNHTTWLLGTKLKSSERAACILTSEPSFQPTIMFTKIRPPPPPPPSGELLWTSEITTQSFFLKNLFIRVREETRVELQMCFWDVVLKNEKHSAETGQGEQDRKQQFIFSSVTHVC